MKEKILQSKGDFKQILNDPTHIPRELVIRYHGGIEAIADLSPLHSAPPESSEWFEETRAIVPQPEGGYKKQTILDFRPERITKLPEACMPRIMGKPLMESRYRMTIPIEIILRIDEGAEYSHPLTNPLEEQVDC